MARIAANVAPRRRRNAVAAAAGALFLFSGPTPASADWQNTKWGMSVEDVKRVRPDAREAPPDVVKELRTDSTLPVLVDAYSTSEFKFRAVFSVDRRSRKLMQVRLDLPLAHDCSRLKEALTTRYGAPRTDSDYKVGQQVLFYIASWRGGNDQISWMHWLAAGKDPEACNVTYRGPSQVKSDGL